MNLMTFMIAAATAPAAAPAAAGQAAPGGGFSLPLMIGAMVIIFYLMVFRPQSKRQKEFKAMLEKIGKGSEVVTSGGIVGVVTGVDDNFITIEVADNVRIRVQKGAISQELPKGTLKSSS